MRFALEFGAYVVEARTDVLVEGERIARLRNVYSPEFSGPFKYVLKNIPVNRSDVPYIELSLYGFVFQLNGSPGCCDRLEFAELVGVTNIP
jgi:hypothetical protein